MDSMDVNKGIAALLVAGIAFFVTGMIGDNLVRQEPLEKSVLSIAAAPEPSAGGPAKPAGPAPIAPLLAAADPKAGEQIAHRVCVACHTFDNGGTNGGGPNLYGVVGGPHDHVAGFNYSPAIINMKTGALFAVSCELGAMLNAAPAAAVKCMYEFGINLGIAYQIYDDCLDIFGQERLAGKSLGTDMKKGKLTLPFLLLLQHVGIDSREELGALMFHNNQEEQQRLLKLVLGNGVIGESLATINVYIARAEGDLADLPSNVYTRSLRALAGYLSEQSRLLLKEVTIA